MSNDEAELLWCGTVMLLEWSIGAVLYFLL